MDERFHEGIREFNRGYFFEAHDILEDLWHEYRESDRLFLQGLIQVAVGFYHFENRNLKGARSQFSKACAKLEPYQPIHQHVLIGKLLVSVNRCLEVVRTAERGEAVEFEKFEIPKIQYTNQ
ncbi:MAG: DUF309 domain-containing protein [Ignavibacteriales bacterium]|nr:DUF309 domain-containing protein [Ignavibacteriales bacterium]